MKKFNLFNEIIVVDTTSFKDAITSQKPFAINIKGEVKFEPLDNNEILIYQGKPDMTEDFSKVLGKNYQLVEDGSRVLIKAFSNWQELIKINTPRASYDDTTADGVGEFSDKELEEIGWHATEFKINYRMLVEVLEEKCEGIVLCIEQEEPYQFSGLGFIKDNSHAKEVLFEYCKNIAKDKIQNDEYYKTLTDDEEEAAEFFGVINSIIPQ